MTSTLRSVIAGTVSLTALAIATVLGCSASSNSGFPGSSTGAGGGGTGGTTQILGGNGGSGGTTINTGGTGATGQAGGTIGTGNSDGGLSGCATDEYTGQIVPLDMYLLLDKSGSMGSSASDGGPAKWPTVTGAIKDFMKLPGTDGIGMALGFFPIKPQQSPPTQCGKPEDCYPYGDECFFGQCAGVDPFGQQESCVGKDYSYPAVPMAALPGVAQSIEQAIDSTDPDGMTPMAPALWGGMTYASWWADQHPDHVTIVVLATDGYPTDCADNEIENVVSIAEGGLQSKGIRTFVIGIGQLDDLNAIAKAGGTDKAILVGQGGDPGGEFLAALDQIRGSVGCIYKLPVPESGTPDPDLLNVAYTPDGSDQEIYPRVDGESDCGGDKGWYYDDSDNPSKIYLCPSSCDEVQHTPGKVQIVMGCASIVK